MIKPRREMRAPRDLDPDLDKMDRRRVELLDDLNALRVERERRMLPWPEQDRRHALRRVADRRPGRG